MTGQEILNTLEALTLFAVSLSLFVLAWALATNRPGLHMKAVTAAQISSLCFLFVLAVGGGY